MWPDVAMNKVGIAELKDQLSAHLRAVERGGEVVVTDRSRPIARIVPMALDGGSARLIPPERPFAEIRDRRRTPVRWHVSSADLLQEERRERRP
jgi:prevent-host-death family protein